MNKVQPIKDNKKLEKIAEWLEAGNNKHQKRMYLLFVTLYWTGLRIGDVVQLRKEDVTGKEIYLIEKKTGKEQRCPIPDTLRQIYAYRLQDMDDSDFIFPSRRRDDYGNIKPITTQCAWHDMQIIKDKFCIKGPFGCHSLRKTHGYMRYINGAKIELLREHFNHSSDRITRLYIGMDYDEQRESMRKMSLGKYKPKIPAQTRKHDEQDTQGYGERKSSNKRMSSYEKRLAVFMEEEAKRTSEENWRKKEHKREYDHNRYMEKKMQRDMRIEKCPSDN